MYFHLNINNRIANLQLLTPHLLRSHFQKHLQNISSATMVLGALLVSLQLIDAYFTLCGISALGISAEGNPIIAILMVHTSPLIALIIAKFSAVALIIFLVLASSRVFWVQPSLYVLNTIYFLGAILPWYYLLSI